MQVRSQAGVSLTEQNVWCFYLSCLLCMRCADWRLVPHYSFGRNMRTRISPSVDLTAPLPLPIPLRPFNQDFSPFCLLDSLSFFCPLLFCSLQTCSLLSTTLSIPDRLCSIALPWDLLSILPFRWSAIACCVSSLLHLIFLLSSLCNLQAAHLATSAANSRVVRTSSMQEQNGQWPVGVETYDGERFRDTNGWVGKDATAGGNERETGERKTR